MSGLQTNAGAHQTSPTVGYSRKKQKVVGVPKGRLRRRVIDDKVEELPSKASRGTLSRLLDGPLDILLEVSVFFFSEPTSAQPQVYRYLRM